MSTRRVTYQFRIPLTNGDSLRKDVHERIQDLLLANKGAMNVEIPAVRKAYEVIVDWVGLDHVAQVGGIDEKDFVRKAFSQLIREMTQAFPDLLPGEELTIYTQAGVFVVTEGRPSS